MAIVLVYSNLVRCVPEQEFMGYAVGSTGLPFIGESFEFFRDTCRFTTDKFDKHGEISRTNVFGTDAAIIWGTENIKEVRLRDSNAEVNDDNGRSPTFGGSGFLSYLKTIGV